jgi:hypothetical protein
VLLRHDDERHWLRAAPELAGHLFPRLLGQSEYNARLKACAPLMEAALHWTAEAAPGSAEPLRLMDGTPVPCGQSVVTAKRSDLAGYAGYGYCASHSRFCWGARLLLIMTCDATITGFALASPKLDGERETVRVMLDKQPANQPGPGTALVADKGLAGEDSEEFLAGEDPQLTLARPARKNEKTGLPFPNWLRQRVQAVIWTLKNQAQPRTPRRPRSRRPVSQGRPAAARPQHRDLAQLAHRRPGQTVPDRPRPRDLLRFPGQRSRPDSRAGGLL